ncbi:MULTISPECIES: hypothetical protein [unclassified Microbacterium]|nr:MULTISPECIES: hypothetical protein [unclassified Microbacterium]NYF29823.1 Flp pilus assembly protein TadG [Microbacterium sp. JAI119]RBO73250.1 hypothetical protein DSP71_06460 [Microbacterium sp. H6]
MATFIVSSDSFSGHVFASQVGVKAEDLRARTDGDGANKLTDGKAQWRTGLSGLILDEQGNVIREDQGITVAILSKVDILRNVDYKLVGTIRVTPYVTNNNRQGLSIIADSVVPVKGNEQK